MGATLARSRSRSRTRRGRPAAATRRDVRELLLATARTLFLKYGYRAVSARQVAMRAGVDPAMVQYYFKGKRGLYLAMLERTVAPLREALESAREAGAQAPDLAGVLELYMRMIAANRWMPALLMREVLSPEGAFREDFVESFVRPMAARLLAVVRRAQLEGRVDRTLRPEHVIVTFLSLGLWPFLARPILPRVLGLELEGAELEGVIRNAQRSLAAAVGSRP